MALERLEFASIELGASTIYSTASNASTYIRVRVDYTLNSNTATVVDDVSGYFGSGSIEDGYRLRSPSEFSSPVEITNWNSGTKTLTLDGNSAQTATNQLTFISLPAGKIFIESASFAKVGGSTVNPPNNFTDVTGSDDAEYSSGDKEWGVVGLLASTSSINTGLSGMYGQYILSSFERRNSSTQANIFLTASDTIQSFQEEPGYTFVSEQGQGALLLSEKSGSFLNIAGKDDISGNQSLGLGSYQNIVAATLAQLTSGSGAVDAFPYTGSAQITGSLGVTGSSEILLNTSENFLIKNAQTPTQSLFQIDDEGVALFRAREGSDGTPGAVVGGMYFTTASAFLGVDGI